MNTDHWQYVRPAIISTDKHLYTYLTNNVYMLDIN